jgi:hypothetical protein
MLLANKLIGFQFSFGQVAEDTYRVVVFCFFHPKKKKNVVDDFSIFQIFNLCVLFEEQKQTMVWYV